MELESLCGIESNKMRILTGFPPKPLEPSEYDLVNSLGLRSNDILTVQEGEARVQFCNTGLKYVPPVAARSHFIRRICPADNSCLFHASAYILHNKSRTDGPLLRQRCVDVVLSRPDMYNQETIGSPNEQYASWLSQKDSWGGAVELQILSTFYQTEIIALDLESSTMQHFGNEEGYNTRGFVVYTGNHFDCIAMNPTYNSPSERDDQVLFNVSDETVVTRAQRFVNEERENMRKSH